MMKTKVLFISMMVIGTLMVINSTSWMGMWTGLEMNMMSIIPLLKDKTKKTSEACMIYFLTQSVSSSIFLVSCLMSTTNLIKMNSFYNLMIVSMLIKLGAAPFHAWFPEVMSKISWTNCMLMMTWQKIAPISVISSIWNMKIMNLTVMASVIMGALGGINQASLKKIMAYSSIHHLGWMLAVVNIQNNWMEYLTIYSIISIMLIFMFMSYNMLYLNQINAINLSPMEKITLTTSMMSLGGLPPFIGFLPKWIVLQTLIQQKMIMIPLIMIMCSLISLFYYLRTMSFTMMMKSTTNKWINIKSKKTLINTMMIINMSLPMSLIMSFN
uniref:NADH dehydrogenase subunit 2 n=1 Tax=Coptosoma variegatum TaxID=2968960 RepID=UPI00223701E2|nr:NADH dehydrogenase subunit 2 [Coptosoma variegatum]UYA97850.1 NADH dehydrogenase subunit 2 [Coptosoma variegatum]